MRIMSALGLIAFCLAVLQPASAADTNDRFVEFKGEELTDTYDKNTVEIVIPGKFIITHTMIDNVKVMAFRLKALEIVRSYCDRPAGEYPLTKDQLSSFNQMGVPIEPIKVVLGQPDYRGKRAKTAWWLYKRQERQDAAFLLCGKEQGSEYLRSRSDIMNGTQMKELYDCKRGIVGLSPDGTGDLLRMITVFVRDNPQYLSRYATLCRIITGSEPYLG